MKKKYIQICTFPLYIDAYSSKISYAMVVNRKTVICKKGYYKK